MHTHNLLTHNLLTQNLHTHTRYSHTTCSHTTCPHTTYSHTTCTHTHTTYSHTHTTCTHAHNLLTHNLHTHTHLLTRNLLTHNLHTHNLHTTYSHTTCTHTQLTHTPLVHTQLVHTHNLSTVSRGNFAWQAWHFVTFTFTLCGRCGTLRGRRGTYGTGLALVARLVLFVAPGSRGCWRGRRGWHLETSIFVSRGRRATSTFAWQLWHVWQLAWRHPSSFHVAGVVLAHNLSSHNLLTHNLLTHNLSSHHLLTHNLSSHNLLWRGRCGTYGTGLALVARLVLGVAPGRRGCWRGRRGTWKHPSPFHVAGVVLGDIDF